MKLKYSEPSIEVTQIADVDILLSSQTSGKDNHKLGINEFSDSFFGGDWSGWDMGELI